MAGFAGEAFDTSDRQDFGGSARRSGSMLNDRFHGVTRLHGTLQWGHETVDLSTGIFDTGIVYLASGFGYEIVRGLSVVGDYGVRTSSANWSLGFRLDLDED